MARRGGRAGADSLQTGNSHDLLIYRLLRLPRRLLMTHFGESDNETAYDRWLRRHAAGKEQELQQWADHPTLARLRLVADAEPNAFRLEMSHANFRATVSVTYNIEAKELTAGNVTRFTGEVTDALVCAIFWTDRLADLMDDLDFEAADVDDSWPGPPAELPAASATADVLTGAPPAATPADAREVERLARSLRRMMKTDDQPDLPDRDRDWLESTPQSLWPILGGIINASTAARRDDALLDGWHFLLRRQLEMIRYRADRGRDWAIAMLDEYQDRVITLAVEQRLGHDDVFALSTALSFAKVPIKPELSEAVVESGPAPPAATLHQTPGDAIRPLIDEMVRQVTSPFEVIESLSEMASVVPPALRCFMAHELALSPHHVMREAVPLMLLDAESEVRRAAAAALEQTAAPETLSPESLRRAIALRNWIPEADRGALDQAIRKARLKGVQPAQWPAAAEPVLRASHIDGSGVQSVLFVARSGRSGLFAGTLLKQAFGVRDAWCDHDATRREISTALAELQREVPTPEVERPYIDRAVQHAIAIGLQEQHLPGPALLDIAEASGGADWKDRRIDVASDVAHMFAELRAEERNDAGVGRSLQRSLAWMRQSDLTMSWFEDDAEIRAAIAGAPQKDSAALIRALLAGPLDHRREIWAERFLLTVLWAQAIKSGQPQPFATRGMTWRDLLVLAHELLAGRPMNEIPVMVEVATRTVAAAHSPDW